MKTLCGMLAIATMFALSACGGMGMGGDGDGNGGGGYDASKAMIDHFKNSGVGPAVACHADPQEGQAWEFTSKTAAGESGSGWMCCKRDGNTAVLENDTGQGYVIAYQVDLTKPATANVVKAWIGKKNGTPEECKVNPPVEATGDAPPANYTTTTEDGSINLAGKDWACTITTTKGEGWESKSWIAKEGWFNCIVKMESAGMEMWLANVRTDCTPWLDWASMKTE